MRDTRRNQTGTRCNKINNHSNFHTTANWINHAVANNNTYSQVEKNHTMDNNNNEDNQEPERYPRDEEGRMKYHYGAEDIIMKIKKRRQITGNQRLSEITNCIDKTGNYAPPLQQETG